MYQLEITNIIEQPGENVTFIFKSVGQPFPTYQAGQFLSLIFHFGDKELRRSYSFNSSPVVNEPLSITVKRVENGAISRFLHHKISVGDVLTAQAPQGIFTYIPTNKNRTLFLFAAGVGITPLYSILKTALVAEENTKVVLAYSNRSQSSAVFLDELKQWQEKYPDRLTIYWIFSDSKYLLKAHLNRDYINEILKEQLPENREDCLFYTCGPINYMDLCRICLLGLNFNAEQIKRETFVLPEDEGDEDDDTVKVVDTNTYSVQINFKGNTYSLAVPYTHSILDAALEQKIPLPYSCKSGMCSTCVASCKSGGVKMTYNEVLTDQDVENGRVLVCTGHPTSNDTVITYE